MIVTKLRQSNLKRLVIGSAADFSHASRFVIDLSAMKDTEEEIAEAIAAFHAMYSNTHVILLADREPPNSRLLARMLEMGVYNIVTNIGVDADALRKCLTTGMTQVEAEVTLAAHAAHDTASDTMSGAQTAVTAQTVSGVSPNTPLSTNKTSANDKAQNAVKTPDTSDAIEVSDTIGVTDATQQKGAAIYPATAKPSLSHEKTTANKSFKKHRPFITIAVCATEPHMGATHHALLITKFLTHIGFKTCYLEANERRNILYLARAYSVNANERKHLLQFEGVDMYFDCKLSDIMQEGYDFLVFDLGRFSEMEVSSFMTKDIKLVIGGVKAWEMPSYTTVFDAIDGNGSNARNSGNGGIRDVQFILNHAPMSEQKSIRDLMGEYKVHYAEYAPYPFAVDVNVSTYKEVFADFVNVERITSRAASPANTANATNNGREPPVKKGIFGRLKGW